MKITREFIMAGSTTGSCGWNKEQIQLLGLTLPLQNGWIARLIGTEISEDRAEEFWRIKNKPKITKEDDCLYVDEAELYANELYARHRDEF